jgi:hypothetical protein
MGGDISMAIEKWFDGWSLSDKIAVIASAVAFLQFLALIATVFVMRRTAQRQLRAYICVESGDIELVNAGAGVRAQIRVKNFGQTPAHKAVSWASVRVFDAESPVFSMTRSERPAFRAMIGPTAVTLISRLVAISPADLAAIQAGTKRIFVWGRVEYTDAFNRRRWFLFHHRSSRTFEVPSRWGIEPYGDGELGN